MNRWTGTNKLSDREQRVLIAIIAVSLFANLLGILTQLRAYQTRVLVISLPTALAQTICLLWAIRNFNRYSGLLFAASFSYSALFTLVLADITVAHNNPTISLILGNAIVAAFLNRPRIASGYFVANSAITLGFIVKAFTVFVQPELGNQIIATLLLFGMSVTISALSVNLNLQRKLYQMELNASYKRLVAGEKLKGTQIMVPALSHELGGPLGNAATLVDMVDPFKNDLPLGDQYQTFTESLILLTQSVRVSNQVFNRYKSKVNSGPTEQEFHGSIHGLVEQVFTMVKTHDLQTVTIEGDGAGYQVNRANTLALVLSDLLENALSHGSQGQEHSSILVRTRLLEDDSTFAILISDKGPGFSANPNNWLLNPQYYSKDGTSRSSLGLYLSRLRIEHSYGGQLLAGNRDDGPGAWVKVVLPRSEISLF